MVCLSQSRQKFSDTLLVLIENVGSLVEKNELMTRLWPDTFVEEAILARNISDLRKALGESDRQKFIETVPKAGYRFVAHVEEKSARPEDAVIAKRAEGGAARGREESATAKSIAVLPFKPLCEYGRDEYLELGVADALINKPSDIGEIVVRPISAVRKYTELDQDSTTAGRDLSVDSVLEGSIQKVGGRIRITARLINVDHCHSLWAGKFDENFTDVFAVQDAISEKVATALAAQADRETAGAAAQALYRKHRSVQSLSERETLWNKRTEEGLLKAIECFEQAVGVDPNYALAIGGLADCYTKLGDVGVTAMTSREAFSKARAAAIRALAIDDSLAEVYASLGHLDMHLRVRARPGIKAEPFSRPARPTTRA